MKAFLFQTAYIAMAQGITVALLFCIGRQDPDWNLRMSGEQKLLWTFVCVIISAGIGLRVHSGFIAQCLLGVVAGCLLTASIMDLWEQLVYRYVWWVGGAAAAVLLFCESRFGGLSRGVETLLVFAVLQYLVFGQMYGRADCDAFFLCGTVFYALGMGFRDCVIHMAITFGLLALVQIFRRNIAANGNLKKPVALIPYIAVTFWFWVDFMA